MLAGAGGLDRGVEGENVGLFGDVVDGGDDLADGLRLFGEAENIARGGLDAALELIERGDRALGVLAAGLADVQVALDDLADLLARCDA